MYFLVVVELDRLVPGQQTITEVMQGDTDLCKYVHWMAV